ncbi:MAG: hypothetical protein RI994_747 [Pseudomonadota bacterium]
MNLLYESESFAVMHVLANDTGEAASINQPPILERHGFEIVDKRSGKEKRFTSMALGQKCSKCTFRLGNKTPLHKKKWKTL